MQEKYFRNALVRANYRNVRKDIKPDMSFLNLFFRRLCHNALSDKLRHPRQKYLLVVKGLATYNTKQMEKIEELLRAY